MSIILGDLPKGKSRTLILFMDMRQAVKPYRRHGYSLVCFGPKYHYGVSGTCRHIDGIYATLKSDWHRSRTWVYPFGDDSGEYVKARDIVRPAEIQLALTRKKQEATP